MGPAENVWTAFKTKQNVFWVRPLGCQHRLSVPSGSRLFISRDTRQIPSTDQIPRRGKVRGSVPHPHGLMDGRMEPCSELPPGGHPADWGGLRERRGES